MKLELSHRGGTDRPVAGHAHAQTAHGQGQPGGLHGPDKLQDDQQRTAQQPQQT